MGDMLEGMCVTVYVSMGLGLFPMYLGSVNGRRILKTSKFCNLIIVFYVVLLSCFLYLQMLAENPVAEGKVYNFNTLTMLLILIVTSVGIASTFIIYLYSFLHTSTVKDMLVSMTAIDVELHQLGHRFRHKLNFLVNCAVTLSGLLFIAFIFALELWNIPRENLFPIPPVMLFCHIFPFVLVHHGESQFVLFNILLYGRYQVINGLLGRFLAEESGAKKRWLSNDLKSRDSLLNGCIRCHDKLCDLADMVNRIYGFIVISGCIIQFNTICFSFCYCYYNIWVHPVSTLGWFLWSVLRVLETIRKSFFAHLSAKEAQATMKFVNKLIRHRSNSHFEEKLEMFALQLAHRKISFSALGLFSIDGTLAFALISAVTTYITIIYQFEYNKAPVSC